MIKVFIVDDHPMVIEGIKALLHDEENYPVLGSATDAQSALQAFRQALPDVVLLDINLPDMNGIELCERIKKEFPILKVLGISTFKERSYITRLMEKGASGYVLKNVDKEELTEAIRQVAAGRIYFSMEAAAAITGQSSSPVVPILTSREKEVLALIAEGLTNKEIADHLFISPLTVDSHRKNLLAKFAVKNTASLIKLAIEHGVIVL
ncbi:response regulator [Haliscomenobacter hydrossis]|uniref:Two component transcriptional regulator, LuxR family n=1 Tax=Haliscomenobacter hydrossis (strain ATCC 27775 / DSM 1100 / LMG 10767 / O) TaxID=760192 RepID=F4KSJ9_HALH1|nr:response regulator transcription factor [Haliscomenobacter hydrossis]AEE54350.1 two component transcriptional regulator, LuxR family [Haliscomenobacter hydrossis DSM 1100]